MSSDDHDYDHDHDRCEELVPTLVKIINVRNLEPGMRLAYRFSTVVVLDIAAMPPIHLHESIYVVKLRELPCGTPETVRWSASRTLRWITPDIYVPPNQILNMTDRFVPRRFR